MHKTKVFVIFPLHSKAIWERVERVVQSTADHCLSRNIFISINSIYGTKIFYVLWNQRSKVLLRNTLSRKTCPQPHKWRAHNSWLDLRLLHNTIRLLHQLGSEGQWNVTGDTMKHILRFSTRRIRFWGQKWRNLTGSRTAPGPDRAYGPRNQHFGHFLGFFLSL